MQVKSQDINTIIKAEGRLDMMAGGGGTLTASLTPEVRISFDVKS